MYLLVFIKNTGRSQKLVIYREWRNGVAGIWKIVTFSVFFYIVLICGSMLILYLFKNQMNKDVRCCPEGWEVRTELQRERWWKVKITIEMERPKSPGRRSSAGAQILHELMKDSIIDNFQNIREKGKILNFLEL